MFCIEGADFKKDPDIVLAAVSEFPIALRFSDPELRHCAMVMQLSVAKLQ